MKTILFTLFPLLLPMIVFSQRGVPDSTLVDNGIRTSEDVTVSTSSFCINDYACTSAYPLTINGTCITSSCSTVGATGPTTPVDAYCVTTGNCGSTAYSSARWQDDVWFSITPPNNNPITITIHPTSNQGSFDPDVFIYTYDCVPATPTFTQQYCGCSGLVGQDETILFTPIAGTPYLIRVFSYGTSTTNEGDFTICIVDPLTDIIESSNTNNISIYPNPNNGKFTIDSKITDGEISIYTLFGENIFRSSIHKLTDLTIDLSDQSNGIYFIEIKTETGIFKQKIIIQK